MKDYAVSCLTFHFIFISYFIKFCCCQGTFNAIHPRLLLSDFEEDEHVDDGLEGDVEYMTWTPEEGYNNQQKKPYPR